MTVFECLLNAIPSPISVRRVLHPQCLFMDNKCVQNLVENKGENLSHTLPPSLIGLNLYAEHAYTSIRTSKFYL